MTDLPACARCGALPRPGARFCAACGQRLSPDATARPAVPVPRGRRYARWWLALALVVTVAALGIALRRPAAATVSGGTPGPPAALPTTTPGRPAAASAPATGELAPSSAPAVAASPRATSAARLVVHFIDVDQGDSILLQAPDGATALIDGGYDNGLALAYLQRQGITRLDLLVATHPHADHLGGLVQVLRAMPVGAVWASGAAHTTATYEAFLDAIADARVPYHEAVTGQTIPLGQLRLRVLRSDPQAADLNDTSLVLRLEHGAVAFLFTGDAEASSERALLRERPAELRATILKVGHHGSHTSSSAAFLAAVAPEVAVYSAGRHNSYGHPHAATIAALEATGARIYGTPVDGTVVVSSDGARWDVATAGQASPTAPAPARGRASDPAVPSAPPPSDGRDRDCADFATHAEAQRFFEAAGGPARDPHRLDGDGDGSACEALP